MRVSGGFKKKKIDRHESGMNRQMGGQMGADKQTQGEQNEMYGK